MNVTDSLGIACVHINAFYIAGNVGILNTSVSKYACVASVGTDVKVRSYKVSYEISIPPYFLLYSKADNNAVPYLIPQVCVPLMQKYYWCATQLCYYNVVHCWPD